MSTPTPTIGRIVHYTLSISDAETINRRRNDARRCLPIHQANANGVQVHTGNDVKEGDVFPMMITRTWGDTPGSAVNGQIYLDGSDIYWVTSVCVGTGPRTFSWPVAHNVHNVLNKVIADQSDK